MARLALLIFPLALVVSSCAVSGGSPTGATCPTDSEVSYVNFVQGFMEDYCLECHSSAVRGAVREGAPSDHNFDELYAVLANGEHVDEWAGAGPDAVNTLMPPPGRPAPSLGERKKLSEWLACMVYAADED